MTGAGTVLGPIYFRPPRRHLGLVSWQTFLAPEGAEL